MPHSLLPYTRKINITSDRGHTNVNRWSDIRARLSTFISSILGRISRYTVALTLVFVAIFLARLLNIIEWAGPPSEDLGGDLVVLHAYIQQNPVFPWFRNANPPIYHFFVVLPLTTVLPTMFAMKIVDSLVPSVIIFPFYFLCKLIIRDRSASLIGSYLFAFSEAFNVMLGWGGTLNLFALFFAIPTLCYTIRMARRWNATDGILAAVFLSLTIGTHQLTGLYTTFAVILVLGASYLPRVGLAPTTKGYAKSIGLTVVLSLPYAPTYLSLLAATVNLFTPRSSPIQTLSPPAFSYQSIANVFGPLASTFESAVILTLPSVLGLVCLTRERDKMSLMIVGCSALAALILVPLLNPTIYVRAAYFLPIPIFLLVASFHRQLLRITAKSNIKWKGSAILLAALVIGGLTLTSFSQMQSSQVYNMSITDQTLQALNWISSNTGPNDTIYTNFNGLGAWIAGYSQRPELSPRPLGTVVTQPDYDRTIAANAINVGNYVLYGGQLTVGDLFPVGYANPAVYVNDYSGSSGLLFLDDYYQNVTYNSTTQRLTNASRTFGGLQNNTLTYAYSWTFGSVQRSVTVESARTLDIRYEVDIPNSMSLSFTSRIERFGGVNIQYTPEDANVSNIEATLQDQSVVDLSISVSSQNGSASPIVFDQNDSVTGSPTIVVEASAQSSHLGFDIIITFQNVTFNLPIQPMSTSNLFSTYNVRYLLLDKSQQPELERFQENTALGQVFSNSRAVILSVP